jgi:mannosyltransferase OCH1-like enzyme
MLNLDLDEVFENPEKQQTKRYISKCGQIFPTIKYEVSIPKIIMQTWKTQEVPEKWKISPLSIKNLMYDWKYILMDDEENRKFVENFFPDFLSFYDNFPYNIQRADAIRYMFLYMYGGVYMDLDFEVQQDLSILFKKENSCEIFLVKSGNIGSFFTNSFMASKPKCNF